MTQTEDFRMYREWIGRTVVDRGGNKIGKLTQIYMDDETGQPEWFTVKTGLFGTRSSFVPLAGASAQGDDLMVPYDKDMVKDAPNVDDEDGHIAQTEESKLYRHYGREYPGRRGGDGGRAEGYAGGGRPADAPGRSGEDAMTRSEEELRVGKTQEATGRARLRKYVVTDQVQTTVPVSREEVRVEREPITDANRDRAMSGSDLTESEHEETLYEEQPVVEKRTVPKERVRLAKDKVTDDAQVSEEVRKEKVEPEGDLPGSNR